MAPKIFTAMDLDAKRWAWLQSEPDKGQAKDQLMIIAAHAPIGVAGVGSEMAWWWSARGPNMAPGYQNAVDLASPVARLQSGPNGLAWIAGHRHFNTVKAFKTNDQAAPENGFWQVEACSLRDFPSSSAPLRFIRITITPFLLLRLMWIRLKAHPLLLRVKTLLQPSRSCKRISYSTALILRPSPDSRCRLWIRPVRKAVR